MKTLTFQQTSTRGFSLVEMVVTVAVVGILSGIALTNMGGIFGKSKDVIADNVMATLNKATRKFSHSQWELSFSEIATSAGDELHVLRTLQWKDPDTSEMNLHGPFMRVDWNHVGSSDSNDHRLKWTGSSWKVLRKGTAGTGLRVDFAGTDLGTPYVHPNDFTSVGSK